MNVDNLLEQLNLRYSEAKQLASASKESMMQALLCIADCGDLLGALKEYSKNWKTVLEYSGIMTVVEARKCLIVKKKLDKIGRNNLTSKVAYRQLSLLDKEEDEDDKFFDDVKKRRISFITYLSKCCSAFAKAKEMDEISDAEKAAFIKLMEPLIKYYEDLTNGENV